MYSPAYPSGRPAGVARLQPARARLHREREVVDLRAGVVVVELARHLVAARFEDRGERVADRRLPAVADVQRPGGLAETNSTCTDVGLVLAARPSFTGFERRPDRVELAATLSRKLMKPGPAIS